VAKTPPYSAKRRNSTAELIEEMMARNGLFMKSIVLMPCSLALLAVISEARFIPVRPKKSNETPRRLNGISFYSPVSHPSAGAKTIDT
jgi:hypothetical protein